MSKKLNKIPTVSKPVQIRITDFFLNTGPWKNP